MITKITIKNFKKLAEITFEVGQSVVIVGPNNSGKSSIFQALSLWEIGVRKSFQTLKIKPFSTINRQDLVNIPVNDTELMWKNKRFSIVHEKEDTTVDFADILIEVIVEGIFENQNWHCSTIFTHQNSESIACEITGDLKLLEKIFNEETGFRFCFLQPMSGLSSNEDKLTKGAINRRLGEGKTAEVLRNICFEILFPETNPISQEKREHNWLYFTNHLKKSFGVELQRPIYIRASGVIQLEYIDQNIKYDISSGGRGFLQTVLLLAYMYSNPNTVMLLDEPDAHLEVIRQRETFKLLNDVATEVGSQIILATHSEVILNEAIDSSNVLALIENQLILINNRSLKDAARKSLTQIGWEKYYLARSKGHIVYLEGTTDLDMLKAFANQLEHPVAPLLHDAFVEYVSTNTPNTAIENYMALQSFFPELTGIAIFDRTPPEKLKHPKLKLLSWSKRELENYFVSPENLVRYARFLAIRRHQDLTAENLVASMREAIEDNTSPANLRNLTNKFWSDEKLTDNWLDIIFPSFYQKIGLPQAVFKRDYHEIIYQLKPAEIDSEITDKLDALFEILSK